MMAKMTLSMKVPYSARLFRVGNLVGICGWFRVVHKKTLFLVFKFKRTKFTFTIY